MYKSVAFTICAKNYLAQALTLKESFLKYNQNDDFFIYLSDAVDGEHLAEVVILDNVWIPDWEKMAFKYDVIEFSTSIKPFCIDHLFSKGYDKVVYLDPDICVFNSLSVVFDALDKKSIVLTPHRCEIQNEYVGPISESKVSNVGIYNLGFVGFKNNSVGKVVVNWWKSRLRDHCYNSTEEGLFVDQKWMDFVPGFFPQDVEISQNLGLNVALWNIQERIVVKEGENLYVKSLLDDSKKDELLFFHFSGFNPYTPHKLDKRHNEYTVEQYPDMKDVLIQYSQRVLANEYGRYHAMKYSFNAFSDGTLILPLNRRMYKINEDVYSNYSNLFDVNGELYRLMKSKHLISKVRPTSIGTNSSLKNKLILKKRIKAFLKIVIRIIGIDRYMRLAALCRYIGKIDNVNFAID